MNSSSGIKDEKTQKDKKQRAPLNEVMDDAKHSWASDHHVNIVPGHPRDDRTVHQAFRSVSDIREILTGQ